MLTKVRRDTISWGDDGVMQTLKRMSQLIERSSEAPAVVDLARRIVGMTRSPAPAVQARAIRAWLKSVWRFADDPVNRELLVTPERMLETYAQLGFIPGDCDEAATLGASLAAAVGLYPTLTVLAWPDPETGGDRLSHVYASILTDDQTSLELDITRPSGPMPPTTREITVSVF